MTDNAPARPFGLSDLLLLCVAVCFVMLPFLIVSDGDGGVSARMAVLAGIVVPPSALLMLAQRRFGGRPDPLPHLEASTREQPV